DLPPERLGRALLRGRRRGAREGPRRRPRAERLRLSASGGAALAGGVRPRARGAAGGRRARDHARQPRRPRRLTQAKRAARRARGPQGQRTARRSRAEGEGFPIDPRTPVLVGVGAVQQREDAPRWAREPVELMIAALERAADDAGSRALLARADRIAAPR